MAHSQSQDYNRAKFSKSDGASLKQEYENFFSTPAIDQKSHGEEVKDDLEDVGGGKNVGEPDKKSKFVSLDDVWDITQFWDKFYLCLYNEIQLLG